eukprot:scaffold9928_cov112-Isochrysis_galbana.AAC.6
MCSNAPTSRPTASRWRGQSQPGLIAASSLRLALPRGVARRTHLAAPRLTPGLSPQRGPLVFLVVRAGGGPAPLAGGERDLGEEDKLHHGVSREGGAKKRSAGDEDDRRD